MSASLDLRPPRDRNPLRWARRAVVAVVFCWGEPLTHHGPVWFRRRVALAMLATVRWELRLSRAELAQAEAELEVMP